MSKLEDMKAFRLLSTTSVDVGQFKEIKDVESDPIMKPGDCARLILAIRFIKLFQSSILLHVNQAGNKTGAVPKTVDERAYCMMIEDLTKQVLRSRETVYLMRLMPALTHSGFVQQRTKEAILESFEKLLNKHAVRERDAADNQAKEEAKAAAGVVMIVTTGAQEAAEASIDKSIDKQAPYLASADRDFIQKHCIDVIRLK